MFASIRTVDNSFSLRVLLRDRGGSLEEDPTWKRMATRYLRHSCAIVVFSLTDRTSFENVQEHLRLYYVNRLNENGLVCLVGSKVDLTEERCVSKAEAILFAAERGL